MIRIRDISLPADHSEKQLKQAAAKVLRLNPTDFADFRIARKSLDARKKDHIEWIYTIDVNLKGNEAQVLRRGGTKVSPTPEFHYELPMANRQPKHRPVVVGFGPAGMFASLVLAKAGLRPIVLERGFDAATRHKLVDRFWKTGKLNTDCNVQFGEGGAGTFSDGKLNTGTHDPRNRWVLEQFVHFGAKENILFDAKPHVGTDILLNVVQNLRKEVISLGGEVQFGTKLTGITNKNGVLAGITIEGPEGTMQMPCDRLILAIGHSARDTFTMLECLGIPMETKPFAMGVRIEHLQENISKSQFGPNYPKGLPPADYKLFCHLGDQTVYSFCMCPGGFVVAAASEEHGIVTNGMSYSGRNGQNANSALLVSLNPKDFPYSGTLGGMKWQRELEQAAYRLTGSYKAPAQRVGDFLQGIKTTGFGSVLPTYQPGVVPCDLREFLPATITAPISKGLPELNEKLRGFSDSDAVLTGPETRSSSPVRIIRGEDKQSPLRGLYPCGEGAGYAGGILSAASDGIRCAEALVQSL